MEKLNKIQQALKAPKNQTNSFGGYKYRSCEDILEAVKPLLGESVLTITDEIVCIHGLPGEPVVHEVLDNQKKTTTTFKCPDSRYYVKATATLTYGNQSISASAYAREAFAKKGMDEAQVTGAASSYARKYALNGLFCIDDNKDSDRPTQQLDDIPTPDEAQMEVINAVFDKLLDSVPDGMRLDADKLGRFLYSAKGAYPNDVKLVGAIVAYLIKKIEAVCVEK
jgi:hypothetical protein